MGSVRIRSDDFPGWAPMMPKEEDDETPDTPPMPFVIRDSTPIEERGHATTEQSDQRNEARRRAR